jgi:hypothetical protein
VGTTGKEKFIDRKMGDIVYEVVGIKRGGVVKTSKVGEAW